MPGGVVAPASVAEGAPAEGPDDWPALPGQAGAGALPALPAWGPPGKLAAPHGAPSRVSPPPAPDAARPASPVPIPAPAPGVEGSAGAGEASPRGWARVRDISRRALLSVRQASQKLLGGEGAGEGRWGSPGECEGGAGSEGGTGTEGGRSEVESPGEGGEGPSGGRDGGPKGPAGGAGEPAPGPPLRRTASSGVYALPHGDEAPEFGAPTARWAGDAAPRAAAGPGAGRGGVPPMGGAGRGRTWADVARPPPPAGPEGAPPAPDGRGAREVGAPLQPDGGGGDDPPATSPWPVPELRSLGGATGSGREEARGAVAGALCAGGSAPHAETPAGNDGPVGAEDGHQAASPGEAVSDEDVRRFLARMAGGTGSPSPSRAQRRWATAVAAAAAGAPGLFSRAVDVDAASSAPPSPPGEWDHAASDPGDPEDSDDGGGGGGDPAPAAGGALGRIFSLSPAYEDPPEPPLGGDPAPPRPPARVYALPGAAPGGASPRARFEARAGAWRAGVGAGRAPVRRDLIGELVGAAPPPPASPEETEAARAGAVLAARARGGAYDSAGVSAALLPGRAFAGDRYPPVPAPPGDGPPADLHAVVSWEGPGGARGHLRVPVRELAGACAGLLPDDPWAFEAVPGRRQRADTWRGVSGQTAGMLRMRVRECFRLPEVLERLESRGGGAAADPAAAAVLRHALREPAPRAPGRPSPRDRPRVSMSGLYRGGPGSLAGSPGSPAGSPGSAGRGHPLREVLGRRAAAPSPPGGGGGRALRPGMDRDALCGVIGALSRMVGDVVASRAARGGDDGPPGGPPGGAPGRLPAGAPAAP